MEKLFNKIKKVFREVKQEKSFKPVFRRLFTRINSFLWKTFSFQSLKIAAKEQQLVPVISQIEKVVSDYKDQYSHAKIEGEFWNYKVRVHHAFQFQLTNQLIEKLLSNSGKKEITIVDIGDSSGNHLKYFKELCNKCTVRSVSVNLDPVAVNKIQGRGFEAILAKAEDIEKYDIHPDIFISFQTLEHLNSPITFLKSIADKSSCNYFVITVPYRSISRVGLFHIRNNLEENVSAERTHVFELCPEDWKLIFQHSGWKVIEEKIYLQYPLKHPLRLLKNVWANLDHEGFLGVVLEKDSTWSKRYLDW